MHKAIITDSTVFSSQRIKAIMATAEAMMATHVKLATNPVEKVRTYLTALETLVD